MSSITKNDSERRSSAVCISERTRKIASFKVMDVLAKANALQSKGRKILHCEVGQPGTGAPELVVKEANKILSVNNVNNESQEKNKREVLGYTDAFGLIPLREKIASHYTEKYKIEKENPRINVDNIVVTTGSSGAFLLVFNSCFDVGDVVAVASSGYPCYRNISLALGIEIATIPVNEEFKLTASELKCEIKRRKQSGEKYISGLILSSPSNPTGTMLSSSELKHLCELCDEEHIQFISDEIYHGISYGKQEESTALSHSNSAIVINSFSKYYSMSGWRLGWLIIPEPLIDPINKLQQNMFISPPTVSQRAAMKCWDTESIQELEGHVARYKTCREIILKKLKPMFPKENSIAPADGGFYIYLDVGAENVTSEMNSIFLCNALLEKYGVAFTSGCDFEDPASELGLKRVRISYAAGVDVITEAMDLFEVFWKEFWLPLVLKDTL